MTNEELAAAIQEIRRTPNATEADKDRARELLAALYQQNTTLIRDIAKRYKAFAELDDLMQEGYIGMSLAIDSYDPAAGALFMTYAAHWIRQQIGRYCENTGRAVRLPSFRVDQVLAYKRALAEYSAAHGAAPSDRELARMLDVNMDVLGRIRAAADIHTDSLDAPCTNDDSDSITIGDTIADPGNQAGATIDAIQNAELAATLWPLVDSLPQLQADVIKQSFINDAPLTDIAQRAGVSYSMVTSAKHKALRNLSRYRRSLLPFLADSIAYNEGIRHQGVAAFHRTSESTTERAAFRLLDLPDE